METTTDFLSYKRPFIIYRINSEDAYRSAIELSKFILTSFDTEKIYIENPNEININVLFPNDTSLQEKYKEKIEKFDIKTEKSDLCIILGGDGCCLWANICYQKKKRPPFITFHLGFLGYLAIYNISQYKEVLSELYSTNKNFSYEKRNLIECNIIERNNNENKLKNTLYALNEVLVERGESMKMLGLEIFLNDEALTQVFADGLIFSSATGSTAYNLSAGGPLLNYDVEAMAVTAICPFSLSFRPIVVPKSAKMKLKSMKGYPNPSLIKDGNEKIILKEGEYAEMFLSDSYINFVILNKFIKNRSQLWKDKIVDSLGWNSPFKH